MNLIVVIDGDKYEVWGVDSDFDLGEAVVLASCTTEAAARAAVRLLES